MTPRVGHTMPVHTDHTTRLLAIDWGSSALRGARLDRHGAVLEQRSFPRGVLTVAPGEFGAVFDASFGDWAGVGGVACLVSGMAGSKQGWQEAPYCACPAGFDEVAAQLTWIAPRPGRAPVAIVPGLSCEHPGDLPGRGSVPDVMRGEEVQIFGAMQLSGLRDGVFVLPGTHSKWARVANGRVTGFRTWMSGEVFALLSQHSILAKTIAADAPPDDAAFALGVRRAMPGGNLLHHAFGARTLSLFSRMAPAALSNYLSGLVIGEELSAQALAAGSEVVVIGAAGLTQRYVQALSQHGVRAKSMGAEATWAGLFALSTALPPHNP